MNSEQTHRSLLGDLSLTQVVAGAMAAATSFALSKQIGVLGSVIGAAVGSVAASIASQLYKGVIDRSIEGIRGIERHDETAPQAHADTPRAVHKPALAAAALAVLVGIGAVGIYATGVDIFTGGSGIGTQAPIIEYVTTAPEPQDEAADEKKDAEAEAVEEAEGEAEADAEAAIGETAGNQPADEAQPAQETTAQSQDAPTETAAEAASEPEAPAEPSQELAEPSADSEQL